MGGEVGWGGRRRDRQLLWLWLQPRIGATSTTASASATPSLQPPVSPHHATYPSFSPLLHSFPHCCCYGAGLEQQCWLCATATATVEAALLSVGGMGKGSRKISLRCSFFQSMGIAGNPRGSPGISSSYLTLEVQHCFVSLPCSSANAVCNVYVSKNWCSPLWKTVLKTHLHCYSLPKHTTCSPSVCISTSINTPFSYISVSDFSLRPVH